MSGPQFKPVFRIDLSGNLCPVRLDGSIAAVEVEKPIVGWIGWDGQAYVPNPDPVVANAVDLLIWALRWADPHSPDLAMAERILAGGDVRPSTIPSITARRRAAKARLGAGFNSYAAIRARRENGSEPDGASGLRICVPTIRRFRLCPSGWSLRADIAQGSSATSTGRGRFRAILRFPSILFSRIMMRVRGGKHDG